MGIFGFTDEQEKELARVLKTFNKLKVIIFLRVLSVTITNYSLFLKFNPFPKRDIEVNILPDLQQCEVTLGRILNGFKVIPLRDLDSFMTEAKMKEAAHFQIICMKAAQKALPQIRTIKKTLEELLAQNKRGRGRAQADQDGFVFQVAKLYRLFFNQEPSKAKNGIFCNLINELFKILFPKEGNVYDKSKTVERALSKLKAD
jgi:hypothetical protein